VFLAKIPKIPNWEFFNRIGGGDSSPQLIAFCFYQKRILKFLHKKVNLMTAKRAFADCTNGSFTLSS
jgi:hypothetical protein